jgi:hypothetical protein
MLRPSILSAALLTLAVAPVALVSAAAPLSPLAAGTDSADLDPAQHYVVHVPRITITSTTVVRTNRAPPSAPRAMTPMTERKADDCIRMQRVVAFAVAERHSVDLVMNDGSRMRAKLGDKCPALDFYAGFYIRPNSDGKMCAGRDTIRSRSGGSCNIQAFRTLVPTR